MAIKIKHTDPTLNEFATDDIIINVQSGSLFYKSNTDIYKVKGGLFKSTKEYDPPTDDWWVGIGVDDPSGALHVAAAGDRIVNWQTTDDNWLYHQFLQADGTRRAWMGLDSNLDTFQIGLENGCENFAISHGGTQFLVSGSGDVGIGTSSPQSQLHISSDTRDVTVILEADTGNDNEAHNPGILFYMDGRHNAAWLGMVGADDEWPDGSTLTGGLNNALVLGMSGSSAGTNEYLQLATSSSVRMTIENEGGAMFNNGLAVRDRLSNDTVHVYRSVTGYSTHTSSITGALVLSNLPDENSMMTIVIKGFNYASGDGYWKVTIGCYWYTTNNDWHKTSLHVEGNNCPIQEVRWAKTSDTTPTIICGTTSTQWDYPSFTVDVYKGYKFEHTFPYWISSFETDLSAHTIQKRRQPPVFMGADATANAAGNSSGQDEATFNIRGAISKGSGTFKINHPDPSKTDTHYLQHSFVESPTEGDNIYRWNITTVNKMYTITLPDYYKFLNKDDMVWISPVNHFGRAYGTVNKEQTEVNIIADIDGIYNVLLIGTRKDPTVLRQFKGVEIKK